MSSGNGGQKMTWVKQYELGSGLPLLDMQSTITSIINGVVLSILGTVIYQIQSMLANITHSTVARKL